MLLYFVPLLMLPMTCMPQNLLIYCNHVPWEDCGHCYAFKVLSFCQIDCPVQPVRGLPFCWGRSCMLSCARRESWSPVSEAPGGRGRERQEGRGCCSAPRPGPRRQVTARCRACGSSCAPRRRLLSPPPVAPPREVAPAPFVSPPPPPDGAAVAKLWPCDRWQLARAGVVRVCGHTATWLREGRGLLCRGLPGTFFLP